MVEIPKEVFDLLNNDNATKVVATKTPEGDVHAIIVGSIQAPNRKSIVFGTLIMKKTSHNLRVMMEKGELASVLVAYENVSYEIRCKIKKQAKKGKELDKMNELLAPMGLKMSSVWYLVPIEVWDQSATYKAGTKVA
jgi:hypothetical protein